jgi:hypothetical protein
VNLVYVYAIVGQPIATDACGIDGRPLRWLTEKDLSAAVSDVPAEDFDEEPLNTKVRDMGWLGPRALAHQDVNSRLFELADAIVPLVFGTVYRDDSRVRQLLTNQRATLTERLDAVRGCAEWVVALHLLQPPDTAEVAAVKRLRDEVESSSPGRAHLLRRRLSTLERDEGQRLASHAADHVLAAVRAAARDTYLEPLPNDTVERPLLRASVLVPRHQETAFLDSIDRLRQDWPEPTYRLLLTGPWPPYRFGGLTGRRD